MLSLLNILLPLLIWAAIHFGTQQWTPAAKKRLLIAAIALLALLGIPAITDYHFSNWILEYFSAPMFATCLATLAAATSILNQKTKTAIGLYIVELLLNAGVQASNAFAYSFGGGEYPSTYEPDPTWTVGDYYLSEHSQQGFSGPSIKLLVVEQTSLNGLLYKEVYRAKEYSINNCQAIFFKNGGANKYVFDWCRQTFSRE